MDDLIYQSKNFRVEAVEKPLVDRFDGGHVVINPIVRISDRQQLTAHLAIECMRLTIVAGDAMTTVLRRHGVNIGRINYQDNGNWGVFTKEGPYFHVHLYGRAVNARIQKYGQACYFPHREEQPGFYADLKPLTMDDVREMRSEIERLLSQERFSDMEWGLR
jgi:diadenosine tetraphosphate (Ap4A) HIT family hydrolase